MSINVNDLKPKTYFILEGQPYVAIETHHLKMQQRRPVVQTKMRNLLNGKIIERNFAQSDTFEEADITKRNVKFLYHSKGEYWFCAENDPSKRFKLEAELLGKSADFLKANTLVEAMYFNEDVIDVTLPVKMDFKVTEAPPAIKGDTATGGNKVVTLETGATVNAPLFINEGDIIRINTETGDYVERVSK